MNINISNWNNETFLFYCFIIFVSVLSTKLSTIEIKIKKTKYNLSILLLTFIFILIKVFNSTGRDISKTGGYYYNFISASTFSSFMDQGIEIGFKLLTIIIRNITSNYNIYLIIINFLIIIPIIYIFNKYYNKVDLFTTVLMYMSIFFFASFSPIRQCLAASIGLLVFDCLKEKKIIKSFIWIIIAMSIHSSAIVYLIPFFMVNFKIINRKTISWLMSILFILFLLEKNSILSWFAGSSRYLAYSTVESSFGLQQFVYYIPLIILIMYCTKYSDDYNSKINYSYIFTSFCFGLLGYIITVFGRLYIMFIPIILIIGYNVKLLKTERPKIKWVLNLLIILYCIMRFWMYISEYYNLEDLMPYKNILGWKI